MRTLALITVLLTLVLPGVSAASVSIENSESIDNVDVRLDYAPDTRMATLIITNRSDRPVTLYYIDTEHSDEMTFPGRLTFRTKSYHNKILTKDGRGEGFVNNWGFPYEHHCGGTPFGMKPVTLEARQESRWEWDLSDKIKEKADNPESTVDLLKVQSIQLKFELFSSDQIASASGYDYTSSWFGFSGPASPTGEVGTRNTRTTVRVLNEVLDPTIFRAYSETASFSFPRPPYEPPIEAGKDMVLHQMADSTDMGRVTELVRSGADPNQKNKSGETPLHWAVEKANHAFVLVLLEEGADPNAVDQDGMTPLHWAAEQDSDGIARLLLKGGADPNAVDKDKATPLHLAAWRNHVGTLQVLFENTADKKDRYRFPVLHTAARNGHLKVLSLLLDHGFDPKQTNKSGESPLLYAVEWGNSETAELLLSKGGKLEEKGRNGHSLLYRAARGGQMENVEFLIKKGMDPNIRSLSGDTPLHIAAQEGDLKIAELLLQKGADPSLANANGDTPLSWTANNKKMETLLTSGKVPPQRGESVSLLKLAPRGVEHQ